MESKQQVPDDSLYATCRRVWVCKLCGKCLAHCKHTNSDFHEDLQRCCPVGIAGGAQQPSKQQAPERIWLLGGTLPKVSLFAYRHKVEPEAVEYVRADMPDTRVPGDVPREHFDSVVAQRDAWIAWGFAMLLKARVSHNHPNQDGQRALLSSLIANAATTPPVPLHNYVSTQLSVNSPCAWADHLDAMGDVRYMCGKHPNDPIHRTFDEWFRREDYGDREQLQRAWEAGRSALPAAQPPTEASACAIASERVLAKDWNTAEDDAAWASLAAPTAEAVRAASEKIWEFLAPAIDHGVRFPASSISTIENIITRALSGQESK